MPDRGSSPWPYLALVLNALVWGVSWWPLRELQSEGLHALWASAATYLLGAAVIACVSPGVLREFFCNKGLWVLALAAGTTMVGFNWGVTIAEVIRVVLLFYLMPIWAVLLARLVLKEPITGKAVLRVLMAFAGAVLVLSPTGEFGFPLPSNLGEWLGLMGGAAFALNNIMLRHQQGASSQARLFGMFVGGVCVPSVVALVLSLLYGGGTEPNAVIQWPAAFNGYTALVLIAFSATLLCANYGLQYGASRLPANITAVVMLSEVVFATLSAILFTNEVLTLQVAMGGGLILLAAGLSALEGSGH